MTGWFSQSIPFFRITGLFSETQLRLSRMNCREQFRRTQRSGSATESFSISELFVARTSGSCRDQRAISTVAPRVVRARDNGW